MEICPKNAAKDNAVRRLQRQYNCQRLVVFGDSLNDISMFRIADEAYAVENAVEELKAIATKVIGDNNSDSVACWLGHDRCISGTAAGYLQIIQKMLKLGIIRKCAQGLRGWRYIWLVRFTQMTLRG